jgi:sugar lactone lactonase YvrE
MIAHLLVDAQNTLGEGIMWHKQRNSLMWVDIEGMKIFEYHFEQKNTYSWFVGTRVSLIIETPEIDVLKIAIQGGIALFNLTNRQLSKIVELEISKPHNRCNDGSIDPFGRLWVGTMAIDASNKAGALYCIADDNIPCLILDQLSIPNGMVWCKKRKKLYFIDSVTYQVMEFNYNETDGAISLVKSIVEIPKPLGMPDGMCMDQQGNLWIAVWGGAGVYCYEPETGKLLNHIAVAAPNTTSCIFDPLHKRIFISSARVGLSAQQLEEYPHSGGVFEYVF